MTRSVAVAGVGMTSFGRLPEADLGELGAEAIRAALLDAAVGAHDIEAVWCGNVLGGGAAGQRSASLVGIRGVPILNVENACASGSHAFVLAVAAVRSGEIDTALVLGVEKTSGVFDGPIALERSDAPTALGMTLPAIYAMSASRYQWAYGAPTEALASVSVKNRRNGARNPRAMFRAPVTLEDVAASKPVADPFTLLHCSANADGAAAVVVRAGAGGVVVLGTGVASGFPIDATYDLTHSRITAAAGRRAFRSAGIAPEDVDVAEVHDAFSIGELIAIESLGLVEPGSAWRLTQEGQTGLDGRVAVNPSGGLLSRGHAVGASGVAQIVEQTRQLRGEAENHVADARVALAHTVGGGVATHDGVASVVSILSTAEFAGSLT